MNDDKEKLNTIVLYNKAFLHIENFFNILNIFKLKFLKRLILKNVASIQKQKVATFNSDRKIINLSPKNDSDITKKVIDYFSNHSYIVNVL